MSIDIERLKVDADYWDEVAPEGATHYCQATEEQFAAWWVNPDGEIGMMDATLVDKDGTWRESLFFDEYTQARAIPRPAKRSREWDVNGGSTPCSLVDDHPIRRIGELGNQVHNLGCEWQADENISDALGEIALKLWEVEKQVRLRTKEQHGAALESVDFNPVITVSGDAHREFIEAETVVLPKRDTAND